MTKLTGIIMSENKLTGSLGVRNEINVEIIGTGARGKEGKSAYEIWLDLGNEGTEQEYLASLKGDDGHTPIKGVDYFDGGQGAQGPKGDKGDPSEMFPATTETLGGVKVGSGLSIAADGTLSVDKSQIHEVPAGGEQNQVMKKMSGADYDYGWGDSVKIEAYGSTLTIL